MNTGQKIAAGSVIVVLLGLGALAAPALGWLVPEPTPASAGKTPLPALPTSTAAAAQPLDPEPAAEGFTDLVDAHNDGTCLTPALIEILERDEDGAPVRTALRGKVKDLGPRPGANGTLSEDRSTYTVAPDDNISTISERVCIGRAGLGWANDLEDARLQVGQLLTLRP